jgi:predicted dehydrogenase
VCDVAQPARAWFEHNVPDLQISTANHRDLLDSDAIEALYIAVPHDLHERLYVEAIAAGKALMGEKPFGIDRAANGRINDALAAKPGAFVRCSSELPFFPGAQRLFIMARDGAFGTILEVESGFWHSSDLDANKPINWKRQASRCGAYGCLGDLGLHTLHIPLRLGWYPRNVRAILSKVVKDRPERAGSDRRVPCDTWDNGTLFCRVQRDGHDFPLTVSAKRIAPGHQNTWSLRIIGTRCSGAFSTKNPKAMELMPYPPTFGAAQAWHVEDAPFASAYPTITGTIFEFGFCDAILQMWAAFCDEYVHGPGVFSQAWAPGFGCVTPAEARLHHEILTAALRSHESDTVVALPAADAEPVS